MCPKACSQLWTAAHAPAPLGSLVWALRLLTTLPMPQICSGFECLSVRYERLCKAYDSEAASAAREFKAEVQSILVAIHNIVKSGS